MNNYINRELSWLKFNKRVLEQSQASAVPDFEQLKFISIFTSNFDEFFMVRAGSMYDRSLLANGVPDNKTGMSPAEQLAAIYRNAKPLYRLRDVYFANVREKLFARGLCHKRISELSQPESRYLKQQFKREILPALSPQIIDAKHPFPHLENKRLYIFVSFKSEKTGYGIIGIPSALNRVIILPSENETLSYVLLEDVILKYIGDIFKAYTVSARLLVRVTRNADVEVEDNFSDDDIDYRDYVKLIIKKREKLTPIRLEVYYGSHRHSEKLLCYIREKLKLGSEAAYISDTPLDMSYVYSIENTAVLKFEHNSEMFYTPLIPQYYRNFNPLGKITEAAKEKDIFLSYPYYSMKPYIKLLEEAADDPETLSIKITLYRLSNNSEVINLLCRAAENGKDVTAVVELKARFDENNNINWSKRLEEAGCNVIYGIAGLKIHSKITLITRRENDQIKLVTHIGTGNYNEKTAKIYTDVGIITTNEGICADAVAFFNNITLGIGSEKYKHLLVAPTSLKSGILKLIAEQTEKGANGYIRLKMNSMTDKEIMDALINASKNGVKTDLIIRGICCLQPGVPGLSENIHVYSIVGRFLEHSRIFIFGKDHSRKVYIGSADMMTRNTTRRIEIIAPIYDRSIADELCSMTDKMLFDNVKRSMLCSNGEYEYIITDQKPFDSQLYFYNEAYEQAK